MALMKPQIYMLIKQQYLTHHKDGQLLVQALFPSSDKLTRSWWIRKRDVLPIPPSIRAGRA